MGKIDRLCDYVINTIMDESYEQKHYKKVLSFAISNYVLDPDIHKIAYKTNSDYKLFYDKLSYNTKKIVEDEHKSIRPLKAFVKFQNMLVHIATFGLTMLFYKSPKRIVKSRTFVAVMRYLNDATGN